MDALSAGALASLVLEGIKWLIRYFMNNPEYDFPMKFYTFMLAVLTFLLTPVFDWLMTGMWQYPSGSLETWLIELLKVVLGTLTGLVTYNVGLKPAKEYVRNRNLGV